MTPEFDSRPHGAANDAAPTINVRTIVSGVILCTLLLATIVMSVELAVKAFSG